jgi:hypothetical protein
MKASRVRDYAIYISIGLGLVGLILWRAERGGPGIPESAWKWIGLALTTPILFGYAVKEYRRDWSHLRFWCVVLLLLAAHLALFSIILAHVNRWGMLGFVLVFPIENAGIYATLLKAGYRSK